MVGVAQQIKAVRAHIPSDVTLVCVSKFHPVEAIQEAYDAGERHFGESRVQELQKKVAALPNDIKWHFIGHLQTNKVRDLIKLHPYLIQSIDSVHLLEAVNNEASKQGIIQNILIEVHVAKEETKTGFSIDDIPTLLSSFERGLYPSVNHLGFMTMSTNTNNEEEIRRCFNAVRGLSAQGIMSFGMSDDYIIAIDCGANMIRIGSAIFGERNY